VTGPALEALGLHKAFGGRPVVQGLDLALAPGEVLGLLGPNGAGKSTVFRMLAGLLAPDRGRVLLEGRDITRLPLHRRARAGLGYLPQQPTVFSGMSVRANVELALEARGRDRGLAAGLLAEAGLGHLEGARAETLSGGERRRLEIARCLAGEHRVLLLDEPFAGVDPVAVQDLQVRVQALAARGLAVLLTDHAVREAMGICQRVVVLDGGAVQAAGAPDEVARDPRVRSRYLGEGFVP
jgi:lipopolysaccharide export system ATP-binding protein